MTTKKCRFQAKWLKESEFEQWLKPGKSEYEAHCTLCCKDLPLHHIGLQVLRTHAKGKYHSQKCPSTKPMDIYFRKQTSSTSTASSTTATATSSASNVQPSESRLVENQNLILKSSE